MSDYVHLQRLEFSVTHRCNAHCAHCHVEEAKRHSGPAAIDAHLATEIVRRLAQAYPLRSVMTFGGEPLLYPDAVCAIHEAATACGVPKRQIITNAGTPRSEARARELATRLAESGVRRISVSVDAFHQAHIPLERVERNVRYYVEAGIPEVEWNPCWVISPEDDNPWNRGTREVLQALAHLPIRVDEGNIVQPDGHAKQGLTAYLPPKIPLPAGSCEDVPYGGRLDRIDAITIEPDGGVSICWDWTIGNAAEKDILAILDRYDPHAIPEARVMLEGGVRALADLYRTRQIEPDPGGYYSICDMCKSLRRNQNQTR